MPDDINPKVITMFIFVLFFANLLINVDMGILPAGSIKIKEELELDNS